MLHDLGLRGLTSLLRDLLLISQAVFNQIYIQSVHHFQRVQCLFGHKDQRAPVVAMLQRFEPYENTSRMLVVCVLPVGLDA